MKNPLATHSFPKLLFSMLTTMLMFATLASLSLGDLQAMPSSSAAVLPKSLQVRSNEIVANIAGFESVAHLDNHAVNAVSSTSNAADAVEAVDAADSVTHGGPGSPLDWAMQQRIQYRLNHAAGIMIVNGFLDTDPEFQDMVYGNEDFDLAVGGIINEEVLNVMKLGHVNSPPRLRCDNVCLLKRLIQQTSAVSKKVLTRVGMLRTGAKMGASFTGDEIMTQRIAVFSRFEKFPHFGDHSTEKFRSSLAHFKKTSKPPVRGRVEVSPDNTFLEEFLHAGICSGDEYICNAGDEILIHIYAFFRAALAANVLHERSVLHYLLKEAHGGHLSEPGNIWQDEEIITHDIFPHGEGWVEESESTLQEWIDSMEMQKRAVADFSPARSYWAESYNTSNGRLVIPTLIMDTNETRALSPILLAQGYRRWIPWFGGPALVRQSGLIKPTDGGKYQFLGMEEAKGIAKRSDAADTPQEPMGEISPQSSTFPVSEAQSQQQTRGSGRTRSDSDITQWRSSDNRSRGSKQVHFEVQTGSEAGEHLDSLGQPIGRATMINGEHAPVMLQRDTLPLTEKNLMKLRLSLPLLRPEGASDFVPGQFYNPSTPSASYVESQAGLASVDEAFVTFCNANPGNLYEAPHGFGFGKGMYISDGRTFARSVTQGPQEMLEELPGDAETYSSAESRWSTLENPNIEGETQAKRSIKLARSIARTNAVEAGYTFGKPGNLYGTIESGTEGVGGAVAEAAVTEEVMAGTLGGIMGESALLGGLGVVGLGVSLVVGLIELRKDEPRCDQPDRYTASWDAAAQAVTEYVVPCASPTPHVDPGKVLGPIAASALVMLNMTTITSSESTTPTPTSTGNSALNDLLSSTGSMVSTTGVNGMTSKFPTTLETSTIPTSGAITTASTTTQEVICPHQTYPPVFVGTPVLDAPCPVQTPAECTDKWFHQWIDKYLPPDVRNPNYCTNGDSQGHYRALDMGCLPDFGVMQGRKQRKKCHKAFLQSPAYKGDKGRKQNPYVKEGALNSTGTV